MDEPDDDLDRRLTQLAEQLLLPPRPPVPDEAAVQRSHRLSWMLVAAIGTLVIGLSATLVALRHDGPRDDVLMPPVASTELAPPPTSVVPATGGIFDPSGVGLRRKLINAMESDADRVYLGFQSADGNEPWGGVVVADAETGAILADHPVPGGVINDSMVAARGRIWFTTTQENDMEATALWSITGLDPPARVDRLDRGMTLGGDDSGLWLQAQGELQLRDPADGALVAKEFWTGFGWVASGEGGTWSSNADNGMIVELDGVEGGAPVALEAGRIGYIRVAGGRVFIAQGSRILRFDAAAHMQLSPVEAPSQVSSIDANDGLLWIALTGSPNDEVATVLTIDVATGNTASYDVPLTATQPKITGRPGGAIICAHADGTEPNGRPDHAGCRAITAGRMADEGAPTGVAEVEPETVVASGRSGELDWQIIQSQGGPNGRCWRLEAGSAPLPDHCGFGVPGRAVGVEVEKTTPHALVWGPVASEVASVQVKLGDGRTIDARVIPSTDGDQAFRNLSIGDCWVSMRIGWMVC